MRRTQITLHLCVPARRRQSGWSAFKYVVASFEQYLFRQPQLSWALAIGLWSLVAYCKGLGYLGLFFLQSHYLFEQV